MQGCLMKIEWDNLIASLKNGKDITIDPNIWDLSNPEYKKILKQWNDANLNLDSVKWTNYYPGQFAKEIDDYFCDILNLKYLRSWISCIDPGYYAPWHWDADDNLEKYLEQGTPIRYSVFISKPSVTGIFVVGDKVYANMPQGSIVKWDKFDEWHAGMNAGLQPKFMYHLLGV